MIPLRLVDGKSLGVVSKLIVGGALLVGAIVFVCLVKSYLGAQAISMHEAQIAVAKKNLETMAAEIERARKIKQAPSMEAKQAIFSFQSAVESAAKDNGAVVEEYSSSQEWTPYLSKYHNDSPPEGWQQVAARIHLSGRMPELYSTLWALQKSGIPFEIDSVEFTRSEIAGGQSRVAAQVNLRVLVRA